MKQVLLLLVSVLLFSIAFSPGTEAATISAANCSRDAVQSAINSSSNNDTVLIPAGTCTWNSGLSWSKPLVIQGVGTDDNPNSWPVINANGVVLFDLHAASGDFRLSRLAFSGSGGIASGGLESCIIQFGGVENSGIPDSIRMDHVKFTNVNAHNVIGVGPWWTFKGITHHPWMLWDHITHSSNIGVMFAKIWGSNAMWQADDDYGTYKAIYIEDSTFYWSPGLANSITDTEMGIRLVFRHNTVTNGEVQMHDTSGTQGARGNRLAEVYENNFVGCIGGGGCNNAPAMVFRGGTGVMYNNTIGPGYGAGRLFQQVWAHAVCNTSTYPRWSDARGNMGCVDSTPEYICSSLAAHCTGGTHGYCETNGNCAVGTCVWSCSSSSDCATGQSCITFDGQQDSYGWPARDQNGRGKDDTNYQNTNSPIYAWGNKDENGNPITLPVPGGSENYLQEDRDFCNHSPATACGSKSAWTYTPYTYPHPLTKKGIINAANCSQQAVQAAVNSANRGDTVLVPAGSCAWSSTLIITKGLTLQGSGVDQTKINGKIILVYYQPDATAQSNHETLKITGFTFDGNDATNPDLGYTGLIRVFNPSATGYVYLVLKNNTIKNTLSSGRGLYITGACWGVASSNTFDRISSPLTAGGNEYDSWNNQVQAYGVAQNFYFEDNTISFSSSYPAGGSGWMESGGGGRYVVRYNTWDYTNAAAPGEFWDVHGLQSGPNCQQYSTMVAEFYGNKIINQMNAYRWMLHRGGWLLMFYNTVAGNTNPPNSVTQYYCNTCQDSAAYGGTATFDQKAQNSYYWRNLASNTEKAFSYSDPGTGGCPSDPVIENTDFFNYNANFDGTAGVGCGPLASRPSTCTTGVGYWATSQSCSDLTGMIGANPATPISGTLYKCTSTNNWTAYYTPYTYPHPLTLSGNPQTCSGTCCPPGEVCSTSYFTPSTDCSTCCTGGSCRPISCGDGHCDPGETCPADNCCSGSIYNPSTQKCCSGQVYTGNCCSDSDCSSPQVCTNHACSTPPQLCDNLVLLMHFDNQAQYGESQTNIYDFSKNGNNGTATGATWTSSGKFSGAFTYDGTNDFINVSIPSGSTLDIDSNPMTIAAWIKPNTVSAQQAVIARGKSDGVAAGNDGYGLWINSSGKINVGSFGGGNFDGNSVLPANTWYHVAVIINGASSALYINGLDNTPASHTVNVVASSQPLKIGASRNLTDTADVRFFNGTIDELAIWNRSLSSQEIQNLYSSTSPISCQTCIHKSDNNPCDGCVKDTELSAFIGRWKMNNQDVTIRELIEAIGLYKKGCSG